MKLLLISADFPPVKSGDAAHAYHFAIHLASRGIDVHILTSSISGVKRHPNFKVYPIMRGWSWTDLPRFIAFLKGCSPDAVLLIFLGNMYNHHPMMTFAPTISKLVLPSIPFLTQFENVGGYLAIGSFWTRLIRKGVAKWLTGMNTSYAYGTLLRDSKRIIVLSDAHREELAKDSPQVDEKCVLIPPPPIIAICSGNEDATRIRGRAALGINPDAFLLVYFGYIYRSKGMETMFQAVQLVARHRPAIRLAVVGGFSKYSLSNNAVSESYRNEIIDLPKNLGISDKVVWVGFCPPESEQASLYLRAADVCVLPFDDGVHLNNSSFAIAVAHGLPVITTRGASTEQQFIHQQNVFFCPPRDPNKLAMAIQIVMDDPGLRRRLRTGALNLFQQWFSWERAIERTVSAFELP